MIRRFILPRATLFSLFLAFAAQTAFSQRLPPAPRLHSGQILYYRIDFNGIRNATSESRIVSPRTPEPEIINVSALLQVEIVEAGVSGLRMKTYYSERDVSPGSAEAAPGMKAQADQLIEVTVSSDGGASQIRGLDHLSPTQQFAWNDWLGRFTSPMTFLKRGARVGQKWVSIEPETASSPIASLSWLKKYEYVRNEPCAAASASQLCAVVLVRATLRQKSSAKKATPEDYKQRNLSTRGTASGQNETALYISRLTGLLMRSMEDTQQSLDAIIALTDGSNQVRYRLNARSHSEILLLPDSTPDAH